MHKTRPQATQHVPESLPKTLILPPAELDEQIAEDLAQTQTDVGKKCSNELLDNMRINRTLIYFHVIER